MKHCCEDKHSEILELKQKQAKVLKIVFAVNLFMFFLEFSWGWVAGSTALLGDSLDMLGDAFVYGFSLYALFKTDLMRIRAAQLKGVIMLVFGLSVLGEGIYKIMTGSLPEAQTMTVIAALALAANSYCLWLLFSHREDDINMKSTWICSRNDIISNLGTITAGVLVGKLNSFWPDVIVGGVISVLFLSSAFHVLKDAKTSAGKIQSTHG